MSVYILGFKGFDVSFRCVKESQVKNVIGFYVQVFAGCQVDGVN